MYKIFLLILFLQMAGSLNAQKAHYDSIRRLLQQDSIEYERQMEDVNRLKQQTDSILKKELGHTIPIASDIDTAAQLRNLRALAEKEIQRQQEEATKRYYLITGGMALALVIIIVAFKSRQLKSAGNK